MTQQKLILLLFNKGDENILMSFINENFLSSLSPNFIYGLINILLSRENVDNVLNAIFKKIQDFKKKNIDLNRFVDRLCSLGKYELIRTIQNLKKPSTTDIFNLMLKSRHGAYFLLKRFDYDCDEFIKKVNNIDFNDVLYIALNKHYYEIVKFFYKQTCYEKVNDCSPYEIVLNGLRKAHNDYNLYDVEQTLNILIHSPYLPSDKQIKEFNNINWEILN
jgi:hypothetical protein